MIRTLIQISAIIFTLEAAWFLLQGNLGLTVKDIAEVASTKLNYNPDVVKSLSRQKADSWVGFLLLLGAFFLQLSNGLWAIRWKDFAVNRNGVILSVIIGALVFVGCHVLSQTKTKAPIITD